MMRGSITIFFSLIFVTIVAVLTTTLESARWACARLYIRQASEDAVRSVFADYCRPLFEEYGVIFLDETYGNGESMVDEKLKEYLKPNLNPNYGRLRADSFLCKSSMADTFVEKKVVATDGMGEVFRKAACEYMKYRLPADFAEEFLAQLDFINRADEVKEFFSQINRIQDDLEKIDESVMKINGLVESIRGLQQSVTDIAAEVNELLKIEVPDKVQKKLLEDKKELLLATKQDIVDAVEQIIANSGIYEEITARVSEYLHGLADDWLSGNVSENIRFIVLSEIESLLVYSGGKGDTYGIEKNCGLLERILEQLYMWVGDYTTGSFPDLNGITVELPELITDGFMRKFDVEELWSDFCSNGFYPLMCPGYADLSKAVIEPFASRGYVWERAELYKADSSAAQEVADFLVFQEYIKHSFADYTDVKDDTVIKYEAEYIIAGKSVDRENIDAVIGRLLILREGLNLVYLMCDSQKKNEAHALAMSCLGFSGVYVGVKVLEYSILAVWALGEAMLDVKILMSGGSVPVIKGTGDWNLGIESLTDIGCVLDSVTSRREVSRSGGWDYKDYLHVFLYMQNKDEQVLRVMDIVEANIKKNYSKAFKITNCVQSLSIKVGFDIRPVFTNKGVFNSKYEIAFGYSY